MASKGRKDRERKERLQQPPDRPTCDQPLPPVPDLPAPAAIPGFLELEAQQQQRLADEACQLPEGYINHLHAKELRALITERAARQIEALKLYEPLPVQDAFLASPARIRLARGSNRSGKTMTASVEVSRAVCGCDPFNRYPKSDGRAFCVGKSLRHVGEVMWRKLGRAGQFRIIRDEQTKLWRAFRPWSEYDAAHIEKSKPAPPLIPPRFIKDISWESKKDSQPKKVTLHNGWELSFFSGDGKPPNGVDIDLFWFDEEIPDGEWFPEMSARIIDRRGRGIWSATPQAGTDQLYELHEKADKYRAEAHPRPLVEEFVILLSDNAHLGEQEKKDFIETISLEQRSVRVGGEFAVNQKRVYPEFSLKLHGVEREIDGKPWEEATREWTRYMVVDPGHQICAVLFAAVPPKEFGDFVYLEDELYLRDCNAAMFAERVEQTVRGRAYQAFLMDAHMAIHTELGIGKTVQQQYSEALLAKKVFSVSTRNQFYLASGDVLAGVAAVKEMLRVRQDGTTRLRVLKHLMNLDWEIKRYHNKVLDGVVQDKPNQRKNNHLCDTLRYLAMFNPRYVKPPERKPPPCGAYLALQRKREKQREKDGPQLVRLGPGSSPWTP